MRNKMLFFSFSDGALMDGMAADEPVGSSPPALSKGSGSTKGLTQRGALENPSGFPQLQHPMESYTLLHGSQLAGWLHLGPCWLLLE